MPEFSNRTEIFRNKDLLERDYIPDNFQARTEELRKYKDALYPVYNDEKPKNIFIHGDAGTGKTSLTRYLIEHLTIDAKNDKEIDITSVYINCHSLKNSYQLAIELTNNLREQRRNDTQENLPKSGHPERKVFDALFEELKQTDGSTVLVLDELNHIEDHDLLYEIPRAHSNDNLSENTRAPCIIGIANNADYLSNLAPSVADTLNDTTIHFTPYNAPTLESILESRAENAFYNDVLNEAVIPRTAALVAQENGSARRALRLLRTAGEIARSDHENTVTEAHVNLAENQLDRELVQESINEGTIQTQLALLSIATAASNENTPERTSNLHDLYENIAGATSHTQLGRDRYRHRLETLSERSIINSKTKNDDGQYNEYRLNKDLIVILDALADNRQFKDVIQHIIKNARNNHLITSDDLEDTTLETLAP